MTNSIAEEIGRIPMSPFLAATLSRAASYADSQGHLQVTIEHLLLALSEDPEATVVLRSSNIDLGRLAADVSAHLGRIEERGANGASREVAISQDLKRILEAAAAAASQGRRREINGAIVLAAVIGEGRSVAAHMLRAQGMTFETAIKALQQLQNSPVPQTQPAAIAPRPTAPSSTDEILASARERVQTRTAPPQTREVTAPPAPAPAPPSADFSLPPSEPPRPTLSIDPQPPQMAPRPEPVQPAPAPMAPPPQMRPPQEQAAQVQPSAPSYEPRWEPAVPRAPAPAPQPAAVPSAPPLPQLQMPDNAAHGNQGGPPGQAPAFDQSGRPLQIPQAPPQPDQWAPRTAPPTAPPQQRPPARMPPPIPPAAATPPVPPPGQRTAPPPGAFPPVSTGQGGMPPGPGAGPAMQPPAAPPWAETANAPLPPGQLAPRPRGSAAGAGAPVRTQPPMAPQPGAAADPRRRAGPVVQSGQLVENIPRSMRAGITMIVEARLAKAEVKAIAEGLQGGGVVHRHEVLVSKAMTVRLRAPEGGFTIETASPETQWIENVLGIMADDYASWRWAITPLQRGKRRLQLVVSARTVGADGLTAETALPDQVIEVKVGINYGQTAKQWGGFVAAAVAGGVLARFGETAASLISPLFSKLGG